MLRIDPATGQGVPGNPLFGSSDVNEQRIIAYGMRNPFRFTIRPGTNEVWIGDVGYSTWEEINRIPDLTSARNFGWPCYEGAGKHGRLAERRARPNAPLSTPPARPSRPTSTYNHSTTVVPNDVCPVGSSSIAGLAFYTGGSNYPSNFNNALFFADYSRGCTWVMFPGTNGNPDPAQIARLRRCRSGARWTSRSARTATSTTWISTADGSCDSCTG